MAVVSSGQVSLNDIHVEAGGTSGTECSFNDSDIRGLISASAASEMEMSDWYGAAATATLRFVVRGAQGGSSTNESSGADYIGGEGGVVDVTYEVPSGSSFSVTAYCATAGASTSNRRTSGAGGGASSIAYGSTLLAVGGGGGGNSAYNDNNVTNGGHGGGSSGVRGHDADVNGTGDGGGGGTQSAGWKWWLW